MGFHGVQLFSLALVGYGISAAATGDFNGRYAALAGLVLALIGLVVDSFIDDRMARKYRSHPAAP